MTTGPLMFLLTGSSCMPGSRVYPDTDREARGVVAHDFGDSAGYAVDVGGLHIADAGRRWAIQLDSGELNFIDSDELLPE